MSFDGTKICPRCGAKYKIYKTSLPMRDKDSIDCDICGAELKSWNGGVMYRSELIKDE